MIKEPYYTIDFTAIDCKFEILLNDIPIICLETEGQMSPNVPLNFGIYNSGNQKLIINLFPLETELYLSPLSEFKYVIKLFDALGNNFHFIEDISSYVFEKITDEEKKPKLSHSTEFSANVPFKIANLDKSKDLLTISDDKNYLNKTLNSAYNEILSLLKSKKYDLFYDKIKYRERNMAISMYLNEEDVNARINSLIEDIESGFFVNELPIDRVLKIYGNGKLATFKKLNGEPALVLSNPKTNEETMIELMFHIPEGKTEFEII